MLNTDPPYEVPALSAAVILVRERSPAEGLEVFLLRRHHKATFMSGSFVFPGGIADPGEDDLRVTAARELFEEAGVLLATTNVAPGAIDSWRQQAEDGADLAALLATAGTELAVDQLSYFAEWTTPSVRNKRYAATFYVAQLPAGQKPTCDHKETVDQVWVTPKEALARAGELQLPPPQVRTFGDIAVAAAAGWPALAGLAAERAQHPYPLMPRMLPLDGGGFALMLPWDPEYVTGGKGDLHEIPADHPLAVGPSRFVLEEKAWKNVYP